MPKDKALPSPGDRFFEIEVAKLHGGWPVWVGLSSAMKAELLAHEMHKRMREHYEFDQRTNEGKPAEKPKRHDIMSVMRNRFFGGGINKNA